MYNCDISLLNCIQVKDVNTRHGVFHAESILSVESLIFEKYGLTRQSYYILCNGKKIDFNEGESSYLGKTLQFVPRTFGGKGGFGSMLRAIGAQIEKTTNREACRDLSGRRLRDINEEKRLKNWIAQQADREREAAERKKKKLERLCQEPKHDFKDEKYDEGRSAMTEEMSSSVDLGFKASTSGVVGLKRKSNDKTSNKSAKKKKNLWIDAEASDTSEESSEVERDDSSDKSKLAITN